MRNSIKISNATTNKKIFCEIKDSLKYFCTLGEISKNFASKIINFEEIKKTELKELLKANGEEYKYNFKYSILEVCNMNLGNEYIISRETHWKEVLMTRKFGLNKN